MTRNLVIGFVLALGVPISVGSAGDEPVRPLDPAYKVAFWYPTDRPTDLKYQVYDLAKGEYNPKAVEDWQRTIREKYPNHGAYVRDIRTDGESGLTEKERLASAIEGEKRRWSELNRHVLPPIPNLVVPFDSGPSRLPSTGRPNVGMSPFRGWNPNRSSFDRPSPGSPGGFSNRPTSPFPYPYRPRPL